MTEAAESASAAGPVSARREFAIVVVLGLLAVSMIAVASATSSYVPLFLAWIPYIGIPVTVSRLDRARPSLPAASADAALDYTAPDDRSDERSGDESAPGSTANPEV
ncbi:MAG: hypothetical protein M3O88_02850 [Actinomycetota bacterium]|nr:hypothetical protein [Actinomycetota bacterium]